MSSVDRVLAIDVGQSGIRASWAGRRTSAPVADVGRLDPDDLPGALAAVVSPLNIADGVVDYACLGATGDYGEAERDTVARSLRAHTNAHTVLMAHDSVTAHLGALSGHAGVVTASGTGCVTLAWNGDQFAHRMDGLGPGLGDHGGGLALGRVGIRSALAAVWEGPLTTLTDRVLEDWGTWERLDHAMRTGDEGPRYVAAFPQIMSREADQGDAVSQQAWRVAAEDAAMTTARGCALLGGSTVAVGTGALFGVPRYAAAWQTKLLDLCDQVTIATPQSDPLGGAARLALLDAQACRTLGVFVLGPGG